MISTRLRTQSCVAELVIMLWGRGRCWQFQVIYKNMGDYTGHVWGSFNVIISQGQCGMEANQWER